MTYDRQDLGGEKRGGSTLKSDPEIGMHGRKALELEWSAFRSKPSGGLSEWPIDSMDTSSTEDPGFGNRRQSIYLS